MCIQIHMFLQTKGKLLTITSAACAFTGSPFFFVCVFKKAWTLVTGFELSLLCIQVHFSEREHIFSYV